MMEETRGRVKTYNATYEQPTSTSPILRFTGYQGFDPWPHLEGVQHLIR